MVTQEFYVRNASETDGRGPFTLEQLKPLVQTGEVTPATLYYEAADEKWTPISSNAELTAALFPAPTTAAVAADKPVASPQPWTTVALLVLAALGEGFPATHGQSEPGLAALFAAHPTLYFSLFDLVLIIVIGTGFARLAGLTRLRAAVGFGFLGFIFWNQGELWAVGAALLGSAGLFLSTFSSRKTALVLAWLLGLPGLLGVMLVLLR